MARTSRFLAIGLMVLVSSAGGGEVDSQQLSHSEPQSSKKPTAIAPVIVAGSTSEVDAGKRIVGEKIQQIFRVQNTTEAPFTILRVLKSCGCEKSNVGPGSVVEAGGTLDVTYEISSRNPGTKRGQLTLHTDSRVPAFETLTLSLRAEILSQLEVNPRQILFTSAGDSTRVSDPRDVVIRSNVAGLLGHFNRVESVAGLVDVAVAKSDDSELVLKVVLQEHGVSQVRQDFIIVHFDDSREPSVTIPVSIRERPRLPPGKSYIAFVDESAKPDSTATVPNSTTGAADAQLPADTTAGDIVQRMQKAMSLPIRYRLATNIGQGFEKSIAVKRLSDGSVAMRLEIAMQITNAITLLYGEQMYKYFANENMAIDIGYQPELVRDQAKKFATVIETVVQDSDLATARLLCVVQRDGINYWEIETSIPTERQAAVVAMADSSARESIPVRHRFLIEQDRSVLVELAAYSISGKALSFKRFADVEVSANLPDETFKLPPGVEVSVAKSVEDYSQLIMAVLKKNQPSRLSKPVTELPGERPWAVPLEQVQQQVAEEREQFLAKARVHLETTRKKHDRLQVQIASATPQSPAPGNSMWVLVVVNILAIVVIGWLVVMRRSG